MEFHAQSDKINSMSKNNSISATETYEEIYSNRYYCVSQLSFNVRICCVKNFPEERSTENPAGCYYKKACRGYKKSLILFCCVSYRLVEACKSKSHFQWLGSMFPFTQPLKTQNLRLNIEFNSFCVKIAF